MQCPETAWSVVVSHVPPSVCLLMDRPISELEICKAWEYSSSLEFFCIDRRSKLETCHWFDILVTTVEVSPAPVNSIGYYVTTTTWGCGKYPRCPPVMQSCFRFYDFIVLFRELHVGRIRSGYEVAHRNGITVDNRIDNLFLVKEEDAIVKSASTLLPEWVFWWKIDCSATLTCKPIFGFYWNYSFWLWDDWRKWSFS